MGKKVWITIFILAALVSGVKRENGKFRTACFLAVKGNAPDTVTVLVDLNGGSINGNTEYAIMGKEGEKVVLSSPVFEGYDLIGYHCPVGKLSIDHQNCYRYCFGSRNTTIKALWKKSEGKEENHPSKVMTFPAFPTPAVSDKNDNTPFPKTTTGSKVTVLPVVTEKADKGSEPAVTSSAIVSLPECTSKPPSEHPVLLQPFPTQFIAADEPVIAERQETPTVVPQKEQISLKKAKVLLKQKNYYVPYGKTVKPSVKVMVKGIKLSQKKDYSLTYKNNRKYGKASVIIKGTGVYKGKSKVHFYILPGKSKITKSSIVRKNGNKVIKLTWKKVKGVDGYQILYAGSKTGTYKEVSRKSGEQSSAYFWSCRNIFYMKLRPYVIVNGRCKYGPFSNVKKIRF